MYTKFDQNRADIKVISITKYFHISIIYTFTGFQARSTKFSYDYSSGAYSNLQDSAGVCKAIPFVIVISKKVVLLMTLLSQPMLEVIPI